MSNICHDLIIFAEYIQNHST